MIRPDLPDFKNPPVNEVALSIQFLPLSQLRAVNLGSLWEILGRRDFPSVEEQPPLPKSIERMGASGPISIPQFEIFNMPLLARSVFVSSQKTEIVQVQKDRFTFNWRKATATDVYPRYEAIEERFLYFLGKFERFLRDERIGSLKIEQAEVTYVNQEVPLELGQRLEKVISIVSGDYSDNSLPEPEQVRLSLIYPLRKERIPFGRLHIEAIGSAQGDSPALNLVLLARGKPSGTDIKAAIEFFRDGRAAIVNGFASITSKEMHRKWGRTDDASGK